MSMRGCLHLIPTVSQMARIVAQVVRRKSCRNGLTRSFHNEYNALVPHMHRIVFSTSFCTWQHRKHLHNSCRSFYHDPFTISKMTGGTLVVPPISPSGVTPLPLWSLPDTTFKECHVRLYSTKPPSKPSTPLDENQNETKKFSTSCTNTANQGIDTREEKMSLVQKFKLMYKQYWYVLLPVHVATSIVWYGSFFIAAKSGVDIVPWLEWMGAGEKILSHLRNSNAGYYAIAYAMYKIATPARYTVTIGGTTLSINYLKKRGYIKPVPSSDQLKEMYEGKREEFIEKKEEMKERYQERKEEMVEKYQERKEEMVEKYQGKKEEIIDRVSEKREELRDRVLEKSEELKEKREELRDRVFEKSEELKDRVSEKSEEFRERVSEKRDEYKERIEGSKEKIENLKSKVWKGR